MLRLKPRFVYAVACLMLLNKYTIANDDINNRANLNKKIVIIGAGAAGIAAASKLFENGFDNVTILEAENRIGGRVYTVKFGEYSVDMGGQWVHGQKGNVAYNLANPLGLLDAQNETVSKEKLFDSSGSAIRSTINEKIQTFFIKYSEEDDDLPISSVSSKSFGEYVKQNYEKEFKNDSEMMEYKDEILNYLEILQLGGDSADSWNDISSLGNNSYIIQEGDQDVAWISTGYGYILDILMKRYPDPKKELPVLNNTILNAEVILMDYTNSEKGHSIIVTTKDGRKFEADHVIVTVSLGVLKHQYESLFIPALPAKKIEAIETLGFGSAGKVYVLFDEPFLENNYTDTNFGFLWSDDDRKLIENDPEKMWQLGVQGVWPVEHKPKLIELYVSSKWAKAMENVPEEKVYNQTIEFLQRFMGKTFQIPKPVKMMRTQWHNNPHFRGTYSYHSVQSDNHHTYPAILQESITSENPKLLFAGEATSPHRYSTVDGAIESGWTAAESLIKVYKSQGIGS